MPKIKILHTADIHIGAAESFLGDAADRRRYETLITFERIMDFAAENRVQIVAIAGDLFDSNGIEERFFDAVFEKIASFPQIRVVVACGNHDPLNSESPFVTSALPDNLFVLGVKDDIITFDDLNVHIFGRSFENVHLNGEERFSLSPKDDGYINLMVQHGELKSDLNTPYNAITPGFIENSGMDYIALGHIHKRTGIEKSVNTFFAYCGCPEGQGFDELDEKGVYIGEIGKGSCSLEFVPIAKRKHIHQKADITGCGGSIEICSRIIELLKEKQGEEYADNLYKIELTGEISIENEIIINEIESRLSEILYFVKVKDSTDYRIDYSELSKEKSLKGIFVKKMLERMESADENSRELYKNALKLGIKAFVGEVKYNED